GEEQPLSVGRPPDLRSDVIRAHCARLVVPHVENPASQRGTEPGELASIGRELVAATGGPAIDDLVDLYEGWQLCVPERRMLGFLGAAREQCGQEGYPRYAERDPAFIRPHHPLLVACGSSGPVKRRRVRAGLVGGHRAGGGWSGKLIRLRTKA